MRTLAVSYAGLLGGAERELLDFAGGLPGDVSLACPEGPLAERARADGLAVLPIASRRLELREGIAGRARATAELAGHTRDIRRQVRALRPDLVITWGARSAIAAPAALGGVQPRPALVIRHVDFLPGPAIAGLVRAAARRADHVSVNSEAVGRDLDPEGLLADRLSVLSPGVDLAAFSPAWRPDPQPHVVVIGALVAWKRPELALDALAIAARELPDLRLTVAGAPMGAAGERLAAQLARRAAGPELSGRVELLGEVGDVPALLERGWCLLHCAEREPFGLVVAEALAAGRPAVVPAAGGPAEIVDESCGVLYEAGSAEAAARGLVDVLSSPERARALGEAGRRRAERFDAESARRRFAQTAQRVVERPAAARPAGGGGSHGSGMALVTVTHNSAADLPRLFSSIERHLPGAHAIVVDSGSVDGSARLARTLAPRATVIELADNVGFGRASNAGVAQADAPVTALVNPDVELLDGSLGLLGRDLLDPAAPERILAPLVLSPDGSRQDTAQLDPSSLLMLVRALLPPAALPQRLRVRLDPWLADRPRRIGWGVGCCLVARTETLRRLGPFDERIFLFAEDLDLGLRAADAGVETWFRPDARIVHLDARSTEPAFGGEPYELLARQRRAVIGELRGAEAARRDHWIWLATFTGRIALKTLTLRSSARERRQLAAQWAVRDAPTRLASH